MTSTSRKENERTKLIQEKCQTLLTQMLRDEDNKYCVDCDAKGPRWASWNLGVFLCIRCAGIHRNLGVHISRVKSVNLDTWTPEQVISLQQMGNSRARAVYEAQLPDGFRRPQTDTALESFIRAKYEHKKYLAREWVPPSPPKVDWGKEIDEELEKQKRKKKAAQANSSLGIGVLSGDKKPTSTVKPTPLPAPLPKPRATNADGSPKTQRTSTSSNSNTTNDLLGLSSPTKPLQNSTATAAAGPVAVGDGHNDSFSSFLSATPVAPNADNNQETTGGASSIQNSLAKDEEDFFNQGSLGTVEKDKSGKLTKDSILALYGAAPAAGNPLHNPNNPTYGQPTQHTMFGGFAGMSPAAGYGMVPVPHAQQQQFMTPPNSASMYNTPVMTAPTAFGGGAAAGMPYGAGIAAGYHQQPMLIPGAGMMQTGQQNAGANINLMQTNQSILSGLSMPSGSSGVVGSMPSQMGYGMNPMNMVNPTTQTANTTASSNLNQQFGNLNIGNVWQ